MENISFDENSPKERGNHLKRRKQLVWTGGGLAVVVLAIVGWQYWQYVQSPAYRQMKAIEEFERIYADDKIGGKTPEETLALFLDAVKKGDFDLASQYVFTGSREETKQWLNDLKKSGGLQRFIDAYSSEAIKEHGVTSDIRFAIYKAGDVISDISMDKNSYGIWKIRD